MDALPEMMPGTKLYCRRSEVEKRHIVATSLGPTVRGACLPHPDPSDTDTARAGLIKRFARQPPSIDKAMLEKLRRFVRKWLASNLRPLDSTSDTTQEKWLENSNYPEWRKVELKEARDRREETGWLRKYEKVKSFIKDEHYSELKHARWINARSDEYKCETGPYFKLIEDQLYKHPAFIKHVPVPDRPNFVRDYLEIPGARYIATDYTAFESLFVPEIQMAMEMQLYKYMWKYLPEGKRIYNMVRRVQAGVNHCSYKWIDVVIRGKRMSGEMCTSLGNGFSNLMMMLFTCEEVGARNVLGCVEGDDGLFRMEGPLPTAKDFERIGMIIKLEVHENINTASFCGMIFDTEDQIIVTDPIGQMCRFGWTSARYKFSKNRTLLRLLRSKALSMLYSYPGCPILHSLARYGLRSTGDVERADLKRSDVTWWDRERRKMMERTEFSRVFNKKPTYGARLLVEQKYGVRIEDQISLESYLDGLDTVCELSHPVLDDLVPTCWQLYFNQYCFYAPKSNESEYPGPWPTLKGHDPPWRADMGKT